jgi:hypothetical protein
MSSSARPMTPRPVQHGVGSQSREGAAILRTAEPGITAPAQCCLALQCPQRPQFIPAPTNSSPSSRKTYICHDLPRIKHPDQTTKSEHAGTDRRRKNRLLFAGFYPLCTSTAPGLSSIGVGSNWTRARRGPPPVLRIRACGGLRRNLLWGFYLLR